MKKAIVIICLIAIGSSLWGGMFGITGGYSPSSKSLFCSFAVPGAIISEKYDGSLFLKANWKKHNREKGVEYTDEPFEWWVETNDNIYEVLITSIGFSLDYYGYNGMSLIPNIGFGYKTKYIQYKSSASGLYFYDKKDKAMMDVGIDLIFYVDKLGLVLGTSAYSPVQLGVLYRF